ncbi:MAG: hypothetical protein PUD44_01050 [Clostridiaceae bacterium]|nr:hypothetical protein [Clostridiaceae bacterium]
MPTSFPRTGCCRGKAAVFPLLILLFGILSGCTDSGSSTEGTDWQYTMVYPNNWFTLQEVSDGYFCQSGETVYFIDRGTREIVPLCTRFGCLHGAEPDFSARLACSAYFPVSSMSDCFSVSENRLYTAIAADGPSQEVLQVDPDGQNRRVLCRFTDGEQVRAVLAHRGTLYLLISFYDENLVLHDRVCTLRLSSQNQTPAVLYTAEACTDIESLAAFDRFLYLRFRADGEAAAGLLRLDPASGETLALSLPDAGWSPISLTFAGNRLLITAAPAEDAPDRLLRKLYSCAPDGSDVRELRTDYGLCASDGERIYWLRFFLPSYDSYAVPADGDALVILHTDGAELDRVPLAGLAGERYDRLLCHELFPSAGGTVILALFVTDPAHPQGYHLLYTFPKSEIGSGAITPEFLCGVPLR